jgi:ribonuclease D
LSDRQLLYAANDAYAALRVYHALNEITPRPH